MVLFKVKKYKKDSIEELDIYKVPHPNNPTEYVYMVNTEIKQYERRVTFQIDYRTKLFGGISRKFSIQIKNSISNIYRVNGLETNTRVAQNPKVLNLSDFRSTKTDNLAMKYTN